MEPIQLWAAVRFTARNGNTEGLLSAAAQAGLHLYEIHPLPGGFCARCAAWHYRPLARLARRRRVRLRVDKRCGLFFRIRPLLHRAGLWVGLAVFVPLLLWAQGLVWSVDASTLTPGQQARAAELLRAKAGLAPGAQVTEAKLAAGEYALLQSGEFSWASVNFLDGRLTVEAAAAKAVPEIASGTLQVIRARAGGTVVQTNLVSGTMLVQPGQQIEAGQGIIGTARSERDGTLIFEPAAGSVRAQFTWQGSQNQPLQETASVLTGKTRMEYALLCCGRELALPGGAARDDGAAHLTRHFQLDVLGFCLPATVRETTRYERQQQTVTHTRKGALALARMHALQALAAEYPDAEILARKESSSQSGGVLHYTVAYTVVADICAREQR